MNRNQTYLVLCVVGVILLIAAVLYFAKNTPEENARFDALKLCYADYANAYCSEQKGTLVEIMYSPSTQYRFSCDLTQDKHSYNKNIQYFRFTKEEIDKCEVFR